MLKLVGTALLFSVLASCHRSPGGALATEPAAFLNHGPEATYVGAETCGSCHGEQYASFTQSEMGRSFRRATLHNSNADFENPAPVYDPVLDLYYRPFHRGENLFVMEYRLAGRDTLHERVERIDYIVGSGHHTNSHLREENGYLYQIPVTWYAQAGRWDLAPGFDTNNARFGRPIPHACMACHNAMPAFVEGSENRFEHVPLGIDCERCHGPGSLHVEAKRRGEVVDVRREIDRTIVNPGKLPPELQLNTCERCHTQGAAVFGEGRTPADFRPGMRLADVEHVFMPRFTDSTAHFTMASHPDRLRMSVCFQASHEAAGAFTPMTCLTCHDPHRGIRTFTADHYDAACRSCHGPEAELAAPACSEPEVAAGRSVASCISCHMPETGTSDIPHVRVTDHFIRRPAALSPGEVEVRKSFVRLASLLAASPTDRDVAEGFLTYYEELSNHPGFLDSAAVRLERARAEVPLHRLAPSLIRLHFLRGDHAAVRGLARTLPAGGMEDAWALYRVGEAFRRSGEHGEALRYLGLAVERSPDHLRFRLKLADAYADAGRFGEALPLYDAVLRDAPSAEDAHVNRGYARMLKGDFSGAEADFRTALALDPDAEMALANLASLYYNTGRRAETRPLVRRLLEIAPANAGYLRLRDELERAGGP